MTDGRAETIDDPAPAAAPVPWSLPETALAFAIAFTGAILLTGVASLLVPARYAIAASLVAFNVALVAATIGVVRVRHPGAVGRLLGDRGPTPRDLGVGLAAGVGAYLVINVGLVLALSAAAAALGVDLPETQQDLRDGVTNPSTAPWVVVSAILLAPIAEELFFRGMLFQAAAKRLGVVGGVALSAVAFAFAHLQQGSAVATLVVVVAIVPLGILLAWLFERRRSLAVVVVVHATFNAIGAVGLLTLT